jgi:phosphoglycolate phosphatase
MIEAIVFDFDGTLTELTLDFPDMRETLDGLLYAHAPREIVERYQGLFMLEKIAAIERELGSKGTVLKEQALRLLQSMEVRAADGKDLFPYTRRVLRTLKQMDIVLGIMTRNCGAAVRKVFQELDDYIDALVTREDTPLVKPDPSHPKAALDRFGVRPSNSVLVGDHPTDMVAGRAAGMKSVGVLSGRSSRKELRQAGADHVIDDIRGLPAIVRELNIHQGTDSRGQKR